MTHDALEMHRTAAAKVCLGVAINRPWLGMLHTTHKNGGFGDGLCREKTWVYLVVFDQLERCFLGFYLFSIPFGALRDEDVSEGETLDVRVQWTLPS